MGQHFYIHYAEDGRREAQIRSRAEKPRRLPMILGLLISLAFAYFSLSLYLGRPLVHFEL